LGDIFQEDPSVNFCLGLAVTHYYHHAKKISDTTPVPGLDRALRLLLSAGKTTFQLQCEASANLTNVLLKRRDAVIGKLLKQLTETDRLLLRASSLDLDQLFEDSSSGRFLDRLESSINREAQLRIVQAGPAGSVPQAKNQNKTVSKGKSIAAPQQQKGGFFQQLQGGSAAPGESQRKLPSGNSPEEEVRGPDCRRSPLSTSVSPGVPVGGRLANYSSVWEQLDLDPWVNRVVSQGYNIPFITNPPPHQSSSPVQYVSDRLTSSPGLVSSCSRDDVEGGCGVSSSPVSGSRFLQQDICSPQESRGLEAYHRLESVEQNDICV
jgi:hypothetical protein